ncbi:hypothetical protein [Streptomyces griseoluteus]|nr:hypothetical protein GCM10017776_04270 [Streptomyces griseoluteus]
MRLTLANPTPENAVLTRDLRDFMTVRPLNGKHTHFRVLPDDL